jgi:cold shock CspA family protein/ribosome-associated translation inhibitor RaiA
MTTTAARPDTAGAVRRRPLAAKRGGAAAGRPPQVTLHGIGPSPAIEQVLRRKLAWLRRYFPRIVGCRVSVEAPPRHRRKGRLYSVRVDVTVPGGELVVARNPSLDQAHEDLLVAIRDAFDAARRELMDYARRRRGQVKARTRLRRGRVTRLETAHGFLETEDGREVYFHRNSVLAGFERLAVGTRIRFAEEAGDEGPQASTVTIVRPRSRRAAARGSAGKR